jgi:hypothetical protein
MTIEQAIDEVQIAGSTASGAYRNLTGHMCFASRRKSRDFLVPHMHPFYLSLTADRIGKAIEAVADDTVYPLDTGCSESLRKLVCDCFGHD